MSIKFVKNNDIIQIVYKSELHIIRKDDVRYPWVLKSIYENDEVNLNLYLDNKLPSFEYSLYNVYYQEDDDDLYDDDSYKDVNFALTCACELFDQSEVTKVIIKNELNDTIFKLEKHK